ncbi:ABC transporter permease [Acidisphaera sp. L21]|jgi:peptide/nickel transport system permease protein|uniref:ABC transporter permease n=1 Tax=Acidisphaera sp. L21 TaxID=1641851 RepID=UPI00131E4674|nr:ABC transporter permease [Acidisphaera sp. L21]
MTRWRLPVGAMLALLFLGFLVVLSVAARWIAPASPIQQNLDDMMLGPGPGHLLGTDDLGRDVLSRLIYGAPVSLYACSLAVGVATILGVPFGVLIGFVGGWADEVGSRLLDALLSFPAIVLAIGVTGALGIGTTNAMLAVGLVLAPVMARVVRAQTLVVRGSLFVEAAQGFGAGPLRVIVRHILPNAIQPVIVQITLALAMALLAEASLSFLGLGVQPPQPSWGNMLARAYGYMEIAPEQMYPPGLAILLTALSFNALGEWLRVVLDPTMRKRGKS